MTRNPSMSNRAARGPSEGSSGAATSMPQKLISSMLMGIHNYLAYSSFNSFRYSRSNFCTLGSITNIQ